MAIWIRVSTGLEAGVLRFWKLFELENLGAEAEQARLELDAFMDNLEKQALRFEDKRDTLKARMAKD